MRGTFMPWLVLVSLLGWPRCEAALNLMQTRLIYEGGAPEAGLMVRNQDGAPALLQAWVDGGDERQGPGEVSTPFLVVPPMMRLGPDKGQMLRIFGSDLGRLPQDRESLFWLNVLGLPPKAVSSMASVQLAYRTRIKLFYRPVGLVGSVAEAVPHLIWRAQPGMGLSVSNPSPFYISLSEVLLDVGGRQFNWREAGLIPPQGALRIPIAGAAFRGAVLSGARGRLRWIDDDGNYHEQAFGLAQRGGRTDE